MSAVSGALLHKEMELKAVNKEVREVLDGVTEYQDQINLLEERKRDIQKIKDKQLLVLPL